jgi:hypothetical protein
MPFMHIDALMHIDAIMHIDVLKVRAPEHLLGTLNPKHYTLNLKP